jgi:hypothetical protein
MPTPLDIMLSMIIMTAGATAEAEYFGARTTPVQTLEEARRVWSCSNPSESKCIVKSNYGGINERFREATQIFDRYGVRLIIDGPCASACAFWATYQAKWGQACVTKNPDAKFGVHKSKTTDLPEGSYVRRSDIERDPEANVSYLDLDPLIEKHGGLPAFNSPLYLSNEEVLTVLPQCND